VITVHGIEPTKANIRKRYPHRAVHVEEEIRMRETRVPANDTQGNA